MGFKENSLLSAGRLGSLTPVMNWALFFSIDLVETIDSSSFFISSSKDGFFN
jgi:hypothetical protein